MLFIARNDNGEYKISTAPFNKTDTDENIYQFISDARFSFVSQPRQQIKLIIFNYKTNNNKYNLLEIMEHFNNNKKSSKIEIVSCFTYHINKNNITQIFLDNEHNRFEFSLNYTDCNKLNINLNDSSKENLYLSHPFIKYI